MEFLQRHGSAEFLQTYNMSGEAKKLKKTINCVQLIDAYKVISCDLLAAFTGYISTR